MSTHHSAAPWRVVQGDRCLHVVSADAGFSTGCISFDGLGFGNANLVAAAPDLLAALKELGLRFGSLVLASGDFSEANAKAIDAANAAIAKAEGKGQAA